MSGSISSVEGELNALIKEFLEFSKLKITLETFEKECQKLGKPIQDDAGKCKKDERIFKIKNELLQHFDKGQRTEFFSVWETHINPETRERNTSCQKLEFYLQVHFAILPLRKIDHWSKEEVDEAMLHFQYYLETRGSISSACSELLPLYALPYVSRPDTHPSFQELFQALWVSKLRNRLETFVYETLKEQIQDLEEPRLIELYHNRDLDLQDANKELKYLERHLEESEKRSVLHAKKCEKLQEECRQLMAVSSLLITALESAIKGNYVDMDCVLSACTTHLPDLNKLRAQSPCFGPIKKSAIPQIDENESSLKEDFENKINFDKLKDDLIVSKDRKKALLLQALRWKLTKAGNVQKKEEIVLDFINNDLLDLQAIGGQKIGILKMLCTSKGQVLENFFRFLNAFASFVLGRQYLTLSLEPVQFLLDQLLSREPCKDDYILDMILGTLKKLSIRRISQEAMVEGGAIEWLADMFCSKVLVSDYASYSAAALIFNLSLCPMGKKRCEPLKEKLVQGLGHLLQLRDPKITPYVNGTLFRIFSIPSVREYAKEQAFPNALRNMMQNSEGELKKQLETILELFVSDVQIEEGSSDEEEEDQEDMNLEPEIDLHDLLLPHHEELNGEKLLYSYSSSSLKNNNLEIHNEKKDANDNIIISNNAEINCKIANDNCETQSTLSTIKSLTGIQEQPHTPKLDLEATQLVRKIVGRPSTTLVEAAVVPDPAAITIKGLNANEYTVAFSSRPKIPRTPEPMDNVSPKIGASSPLLLRSQRATTELPHALYCNN